MRAPAHALFGGNERFQVQRPLGVGSFGAVYAAVDRQYGTPVAVKVLHQTDSSALYRFKQEFRLLTDLVHPNLVTLYELLSEGSQWLLTMELIEGQHFIEFVRARASSGPHVPPSDQEDTASLTYRDTAGTPGRGEQAPADEDETLSSHGLTSPEAPLLEAPTAPPRPGAPVRFDADAERMRTAFFQLAQGVCRLHAAHILHRDIKPSNVIITPAGRVVVLDFGLARELVPTAPGTRSESIAGSPPYMSPEQWAQQPLTVASDWYSVGVMLFEALTGARPFSGSPQEVIAAQMRGAPSLSEWVTGAPADLEALCVELLQADPRARPSGAEVLRRLASGLEPARARNTLRLAPASASRTLVGRAPLLDALRESFEQSRAGQGHLVELRGRSGMGKSTLLRCFVEQLREEGAALCLLGRCHERESVPYKALDSLMDALNQHLNHLSREQVRALFPLEGLSALARLFPVLEPFAALQEDPPEQPPLEVRQVRSRAVSAFQQLLRRLALRQPLVLCIDDLQWGDVDSARLLAEFLAPPEAPPLLLVLSSRDDEAQGGACLAELRRLLAQSGPRPRELLVEPLPAQEAVQLVLGHLGGAEAQALPEAERIAREAAGNPLLLEELARFALSGRSREDGAPQGTDTSLGELIHERLRQLPEEARRLLELAAVAGRPLEQGVALEAARLGDGALSTLAGLRFAQLLRTHVDAGHASVEVSHDQFREQLVARLEAPALAAHHRRLAEVLEARPDADPEALAVHFHGAGELGKAALQAVRAAEKASRALAFNRTAELLGLALQWGEGLAQGPFEDRRGLELRRAEALAHAGRGGEAAPFFLRLAEGAPGLEGLDLQRRAVEQYLTTGHLDEGLSRLDSLLGRLRLTYPRSNASALSRLVWMMLRLQVRGTRFQERPDSQMAPEALTRIDMCWALGKALADVDPMRAVVFQLHSLLLALEAGSASRVARGLAMFGPMWLWQGTPRAMEKGSRLLDEAMALARRMEDSTVLGFAEAFSSARPFVEGDWEAALALADSGLARLQSSASHAVWECNLARTMAVGVLEGTWRMRELSVRTAAWYRAAVGVGDRFAQVTASLSSALALIAEGDPAGARRRVHEALAGWSSAGVMQHIIALRMETYADLYEDRPGEAWARLERGWPEVKRSQMLRVQVGRIDMYSLRARAALALAVQDEGRREQLLRGAQQDLERLERERRRDAPALAWLLRAGLARARGDTAEALAGLERAVAGYEAARMPVLAACARRRQGEQLGGEQGAALVAQADALLRSEGVAAPSTWVSMLVPGWPRQGP